MDCHLSWHEQELNIATRLARAKGMLYKIRHYVNQKTLRMIYYGIFSSILTYGSQIWGQHNRIVKKLQIIQNKALRIINFKPNQYPVNSLYKESHILKLTDHVILQNILYIHDHLNNRLPKVLNSNKKISLIRSNISLRTRAKNQLEKILTKTILYGSRSITSRSIEDWNEVNNHIYHLNLHQKSKSICKKSTTTFLLNKYS